MAHGHMIPMLDMARLFGSKKGVRSTIVTTPYNAKLISNTVERIKINQGIEISILIIEFPSVAAGLPAGCENLEQVDNSQQVSLKFILGARLLQQSIEDLLHDHRPDCLVADVFFPWATESSAKFNIPRLVFHGTCFFSLCCTETVRLSMPQVKDLSDSDRFVIPNLPDRIELSKMQLPDFVTQENETEFTKLLAQSKESELESYGVVVNSFYELEPRYADHYRKVLGRKAWHIGPVSLCNRNEEEKAERGKKASIDEHECLKWLDSKRPNSVVYVCFGSLSNFPASQLREIAIGLEASGQEFIWVVRGRGMDENEEWLPEGFEKRAKGLIIRGWAPQVMILDHEAVGGFVTHCGWNSTLEGVCAGVPMVTWPIFAEQFYNEKLVTQVLKIGVAVGSPKWNRTIVGISVKNEAIEKAVNQIMVGEEAEEMRDRAKSFKELARKAIEEGGSSYCDLNALIEELRLHKK